MNEISRYLISPPVGNRFGAEDADRILGSYTLNRRPGRLIGILKTVRSVPGGWINNIGLRNPGIRNIKINNKYIYSLAGIEPGDWYELARQALSERLALLFSDDLAKRLSAHAGLLCLTCAMDASFGVLLDAGRDEGARDEGRAAQESDHG